MDRDCGTQGSKRISPPTHARRGSSFDPAKPSRFIGSVPRSRVGKQWPAGLVQVQEDARSARFGIRSCAQSHRATAKARCMGSLSHLFYDSNGKNTSVGELLHRELGNRLYTVGVFALGGGTVALFSDVNEDFGYTPIYGTSSAILTFLAKGCLDTCFVNLKNIRPSSPLTQSQDVWIESRTQSIHLASEFDGVVWVRHIHPPRLQLRLPLLLFIFFKHYLKPAASVLGTAGFLLLLWITFRRRSHLRKPQGLQP